MHQIISILCSKTEINKHIKQQVLFFILELQVVQIFACNQQYLLMYVRNYICTYKCYLQNLAHRKNLDIGDIALYDHMPLTCMLLCFFQSVNACMCVDTLQNLCKLLSIRKIYVTGPEKTGLIYM